MYHVNISRLLDAESFVGQLDHVYVKQSIHHNINTEVASVYYLSIQVLKHAINIPLNSRLETIAGKLRLE